MKQIKYMKRILLTLSFALVLASTSCMKQTRDDAIQQAKHVQSIVKEQTPGAIATKEDGYMMKAKIAGRDWQATYMVPDNDARSNDQQVQGENSEVTINFYLWKPGVKVGMKKEFQENHAANLFTEDDIYGGRKGEIEITRIDGRWVEGTFHFTATCSTSNKLIEVSDGFFRIAL